MRKIDFQLHNAKEHGPILSSILGEENSATKRKRERRAGGRETRLNNSCSPRKHLCSEEMSSERNSGRQSEGCKGKRPFEDDYH